MEFFDDGWLELRLDGAEGTQPINSTLLRRASLRGGLIGADCRV